MGGPGYIVQIDEFLFHDERIDRILDQPFIGRSHIEPTVYQQITHWTGPVSNNQ